MGWAFPDSTEHRPCLLQHRGDPSPAPSDWDKPPTGNSKDLKHRHLGKKTQSLGNPKRLSPMSIFQLLFIPCSSVGLSIWKMLRGRALKCDLVGGRGLE